MFKKTIATVLTLSVLSLTGCVTANINDERLVNLKPGSARIDPIFVTKIAEIYLPTGTLVNVSSIVVNGRIYYGNKIELERGIQNNVTVQMANGLQQLHVVDGNTIGIVKIHLH